MHPDAPVPIGSNTKLLVGVLLFQAIEEGLVSLEDPIVRYLPEEAALLPNGGSVVVGQLANHTSGFFDPVNQVGPDQGGLVV